MQNYKAKIELLGSYDPQKQLIIKDPYYVSIQVNSYAVCFQTLLNAWSVFDLIDPHIGKVQWTSLTLLEQEDCFIKNKICFRHFEPNIISMDLFVKTITLHTVYHVSGKQLVTVISYVTTFMMFAT